MPDEPGDAHFVFNRNPLARSPGVLQRNDRFAPKPHGAAMSNRPIYTAEFHTDAEWALLEIKAATPEKALKKARTVDPDTLDFAPYDDRHPVNYITIRDEDCNDLAEWQSDDLRLQLAARALLNAAEKVIASWERGDLAAAVRELDNAIANAKGGAASEKVQDALNEVIRQGLVTVNADGIYSLTEAGRKRARVA